MQEDKTGHIMHTMDAIVCMAGIAVQLDEIVVTCMRSMLSIR